MTATETPHDFTVSAIADERQNGPNLPPIAEAITDKRSQARASRAAAARNASDRRRLVDPTTCEKDYTEAEMEFMGAMQHYKEASGRMFPTWSEVLEVLKGLGYEKVGPESALS
jgi:hypothetical protein